MTLARLAGLAAAVAGLAIYPGDGALAKLSPAQADYVEHCAGCHGMQGVSVPAKVPSLRNRVGYFLCTDASRAYLLRLPNVALSSLDDARLATTMNFVVFGLGGASSDSSARRFTADEVAIERKKPLSAVSLVATRAAIVRSVQRRCNVPVGNL
jgi:hypothetical protein